MPFRGPLIVLLCAIPASAAEPFPLMLVLHGGNGDNGFLGSITPWIGEAVRAGIPKVVAVTVDAGRSFYMDYRDGSQKWESLFAKHL